MLAENVHTSSPYRKSIGLSASTHKKVPVKLHNSKKEFPQNFRRPSVSQGWIFTGTTPCKIMIENFKLEFSMIGTDFSVHYKLKISDFLSLYPYSVNSKF